MTLGDWPFSKVHEHLRLRPVHLYLRAQSGAWPAGWGTSEDLPLVTRLLTEALIMGCMFVSLSILRLKPSTPMRCTRRGALGRESGLDKGRGVRFMMGLVPWDEGGHVRALSCAMCL